VALLGTHAGEQTAAALVLVTATALGDAAVVVSGLTTGGLAALAAAEQAGRGLLIFAHHREPN
jgi:hypothetical protein